MRVLILPLLIGLTAPACDRPRDAALKIDQRGFVLNSSAAHPTIKVGVRMSAAELLDKNPALREVAWIPPAGHPFDQLRLSLETQSFLEYDDGSLRFSACAHSTAIDGNKDLPVGVAVVGFTVCDPPLDDVEAAMKQASQLLSLLQQQAPTVSDLAELYRAAPQDALTKIGGKRWEGIATKGFSSVPAPRDDFGSTYHLKTLDEARSYFQSRKVNGIAVRRGDGRIDVGLVKVGVYATDTAIIEVGVSGSEAYGGENLSVAQQNAIRYQVGISVRIRSAQ